TVGRRQLDVWGPEKPPYPRRDEGPAAPAVFPPRLAFSGWRAKRGQPRLCRNCNHPAPACPIGELLRELPYQGFARTSLQRNFESAIFETDEPHVAFERALD